jgi:hypothetical protein
MSYTAIILLALSGASLLGFLFAWTVQQMNNRQCKRKNEELTIELSRQNGLSNQFQAENEALSASLKNLQQLLQEHEKENLSTENDQKSLQREYELLKMEYSSLLASPRETVREIEVIREVPVLVFRDRPKHEDNREKAKKLVKAFRKGYLQETDKTAPKE